MRRLTISRPGKVKFLQKYTVFLDGGEIAKIKANETVSYDITDGEHSVYISFDNTKSNSLVIAATDGDIACTIKVKVGIGGDRAELIKE